MLFIYAYRLMPWCLYEEFGHGPKDFEMKFSRGEFSERAEIWFKAFRDQWFND